MVSTRTLRAIAGHVSSGKMAFLRTMTRRVTNCATSNTCQVEEAASKGCGISHSAFIHPAAVLGEDVYVGPFCTIGNGARIGNSCQLLPGSHVFGDTEIGERCVIMRIQMPRGRDPIWEHVEHQDDGKNKCKFCHEIFTAGITRLRYHLAKYQGKDIRPCPSVTDDVRAVALQAIQELSVKSKKQKVTEFWKTTSSHGSSPAGGSTIVDVVDVDRYKMEMSSQPTLHRVVKKGEKKLVDKVVLKLLVNNNIAFNILRSPEFKELCTAIGNFGPGYEPPSSETARTRLLDEVKEDIDAYITSVKESWQFSGCTVMSDGWKDMRSRPHINLLVQSPKGVMFYKSLCTVGHVKDGPYLADFISSIIEKIGPQNVVQFISDNAANYGSAGSLLEIKYPHLFSTNCAAHGMNLILTNLGALNIVSPALDNAKKIVKFVYKYQHVLDLMRKHTDGRELKKPGATRFATHFLCLQSVLAQEQGLRFMFASPSWRDLPQSKTEDGIEICDIIQDNNFWESGRMIIRVMEPLIRILRMADSERSTIGYLYEGLDRAKEAIKEIFEGAIDKYTPFWKIIDYRWDKNLHSPLHAAAAYLNPLLHYKKRVTMDAEVKEGMETVVRKMVADLPSRTLIAREIRDYHSKSPMLFSPLAIECLTTTHPRVWWDMWGGNLTLLQKLAIRILSQPCSASSCERNWSAFDAAHTKKRNRLDPERLETLVYIRMNDHLMRTTRAKEEEDTFPIDLEKIDAYSTDLNDASPNNEDEDFEEEDEEEPQHESEDNANDAFDSEPFTLDFDTEHVYGAIVGADIPGKTIIGHNNIIGHHTVVGGKCQDLKYKPGDECFLRVGDNNDIREFVSIHRSSKSDDQTVIGDGNLIMGGCHVAHDCKVGDSNIFANNTLLAGHVVVEDSIHTAGGTVVHQFCHLGSFCFIGGGSVITQDVPKYMMVSGDRAQIRGLNFEGLKRHGFSQLEVQSLKRAYRKIFVSASPQSIEDRLAEIEEDAELVGAASVGSMLQSIRDSSNPHRRGICSCRFRQSLAS